jgi:hypothetical protein
MMTDQNMTDEEERAWNELERKQNKKWDTTDMAHRPNGLTVDTNIINKAKWYQEGYEAGQRDERERIKQKERSSVEGKTE